MATVNKRLFGRYILFLLGLTLLTGVVTLLVPKTVYAAVADLEITGPGLKGDGIIISQEQLQGNEPLTLSDGTEVEQYDEWYSSINTWPSKIWYRDKELD